MKHAYIRILKYKGICKTDKAKFLIVSIGVYLFLPLIGLIHSKTNLNNWFLLAILPSYILIYGIIIGIKKGFCPIYVIAISLMFLPCGLIYNYKPLWQYMLFYLIFAAVCNLATDLFWLTRSHGKYSLDPESLSQDSDRNLYGND